jgi:DNA-binding transcriptional LysR family regulator
MEFTELQAFVAVARERSFSRAAVRLFRTQPAVSLAVKRLEDDLGHQLFTRTSKSAELTEAGHVMLEYAGRLCALRDEARHALGDLHALRRGDLTIGANEALVGALLPAIEAHRDEWPDVRVDVRRLRAREIAGAIRLGDLDFGILGFRPDDPALESVPIGADEVVLLVPASHRLAHAAAVHPRELQHETFIAHSVRSWTRDRVQALFERERFRPRIGVVLPTLDAMKDAVELGMGVTMMLRSAALGDIRNGRLAGVRVDDPGLSRQIWLVFARTASRSAGATRFLEQFRRTPGTPADVMPFVPFRSIDRPARTLSARRSATGS